MKPDGSLGQAITKPPGRKIKYAQPIDHLGGSWCPERLPDEFGYRLAHRQGTLFGVASRLLEDLVIN
jgi:hypothetical protein